MNLRDRVLLELDMTNALRPSELFALRWKSLQPGRIQHEREQETAYMGKIRPVGQNP